jgi:hypothetical protein
VSTYSVVTARRAAQLEARKDFYREEGTSEVEDRVFGHLSDLNTVLSRREPLSHLRAGRFLTVAQLSGEGVRAILKEEDTHLRSPRLIVAVGASALTRAIDLRDEAAELTVRTDGCLTLPLYETYRYFTEEDSATASFATEHDRQLSGLYVGEGAVSALFGHLTRQQEASQQ